MTKLIVLCGISGSGKSTKARQLKEEIPNSIIVNRDKMREMLFGYTEDTIVEYHKLDSFKENEKKVTESIDELIDLYLRKDMTVIVDNTHLQQHYIDDLQKKYYYVEHEYILLNTDIHDCIQRNKKRKRKVPEDIIHVQYSNLWALKNKFDFAPFIPSSKPIINNENNPPCIVIDIDGTLAHKCDRHIYDYTKVKDDYVIKQVQSIVNTFYSKPNYEIIIVSGRDDNCKKETEEWLEIHGIRHDGLYMRKTGDKRSDFIVKEEIWREIVKDLYVEFMIDDRYQVIDHARRMGFFVLDVNQTKTKF